MKERKWWNSVSRVPSMWWRASSVIPRLDSEDQAVQLQESKQVLGESAAEECKAVASPESHEAVTPDDILYSDKGTKPRSCDDAPGPENGRHSLDASAGVSGSNLSSVPRALSTPPRRRKEFVMEGIPDISFSFFNDQTIPVTSASEACLQAVEHVSGHTSCQATAPITDAAVKQTDATTIIVGESVKPPSAEGDYEVLRTVIPVNSTPVDTAQRSVMFAMLSQEPSKKSPNISCINVVSINTAAHQENPYASPRNSSFVTEVSDISQDPSTPSPNISSSGSTLPTFQDMPTTPDTASPDSTLPPFQNLSTPPPITSSADRTVSSFKDLSTTSHDPSTPESTVSSFKGLSTTSHDPSTPEGTVSSFQDVSSPHPSLSSPDCNIPSFEISSAAVPSPDELSPNCAISSCQDTPPASTVVNSSTPTISAPLQLTDQPGAVCHDWETITDYSDYYDMSALSSKRQQSNSDYEDVQQWQRGRRATLMRDRRRGIGTMRTRIRRAWRAVRGWLGEERVRIEDVIQRHAQAQAVRQGDDTHRAEEEDTKIVVLRRREGGNSRPTSRAGLRRSRHFPEVNTSLAVLYF